MLFKFSGPYAIFRVGHLPALYTVAYLGILAVLGRRPRVTGGRGGRGINYRIVYTARRGAERQKSKRNVRGDVTHAAARAAGSSPEDPQPGAPRTTFLRTIFLMCLTVQRPRESAELQLSHNNAMQSRRIGWLAEYDTLTNISVTYRAVPV